MGLNVNLYTVGDISDDQLATAEAFIAERQGKPWAGETHLERVTYLDDGKRIELNTGDRYYGPGYERGDWPSIYGIIRTMSAAFPGLPIYYCSDASDDGQRVCHTLTEELWEHYLGPHFDDYHLR